MIASRVHSLGLIVALFAAGCLSGPGATRVAAPTIEVATLWGHVLDVEERPLPGANVSVASSPVFVRTDAGGAYRLPDVPAGTRTIQATQAGHEPGTATFFLLAGELRRHDFRLAPTPLPVHRNQTIPFQGSYDCAAELLILGGDCLVLYENLTGQNDPVTNEAYAFRLPVGPGWKTILVELRWKPGANDQLEGMRLLLEHGNASKTGHGIQVARADGTENPLRILVTRGEAHPTAELYPDTTTKAQVPAQGEELQVRVQPRGKFHPQASSACPPAPCFLGVGVGLGITFTIDTNVYYPPPA